MRAESLGLGPDARLIPRGTQHPMAFAELEPYTPPRQGRQRIGFPMTSQQIAQIITAKFGPKIIASFPDDKHPRVHVNAGDWRELAEFLLREPALKFDWLANHSGIDYAADEKMCCVYDLWSFDLHHSFAVKVFCPR